MAGLDDSDSLQSLDVPDVEDGVVGGFPTDCLGLVSQDSQASHLVLVASVEGLVVECRGEQNDQPPHEVEYPFGITQSNN